MVLVGRVARAHGNRGQVIVDPATDFPEERFRPGSVLLVQRAGVVDALTVESVRFHRGRPIIGLAGVATMDAAEAMAGSELRIGADALQPLAAGIVLPARPDRLFGGDASRGFDRGGHGRRGGRGREPVDRSEQRWGCVDSARGRHLRRGRYRPQEDRCRAARRAARLEHHETAVQCVLISSRSSRG